MSTRVSLIVLNYNGAEVVERCLGSLVEAMGEDDELIVVDNASMDGSAETVRRFCADDPRRTFIPRLVNNFIFGLNDGLRAARGIYVGFLNNDNWFASDSVDLMVAHFDGPTVFAVCPRIIRDADDTEQGALTTGFWERGLLFYRPQPHDSRARRTFFAVGGQSLFDRAKLTELGSIDELLYPMYHEDIELSWRAWKGGYEIRYAPDAVVRHIGGQSSNRVFTSTQLRAMVRQNELLIVWKNITDRRLLLEHVVALPGRLAVATARGDWATLLGFVSASRRIRRVRAARRAAQRTARVSDRVVLEAVSETGLGLAKGPR